MIQKNLDDGTDTIGKKMTICKFYAKQTCHQKNLRYNTTQGRVQHSHLQRLKWNG